jgi:hypothetical protein
MWVLPHQVTDQLRRLSGSTATVEMLSDLNEQSQACAQSLSVRGTPSSLRTWSAKWKRDSWTRFLSGRMLRTSPANLSLVAGWICSSQAGRVKDFPTQGSASGLMTTATYGPIAGSSSKLPDPSLFGEKTSKDTFRLDSQQSLPTWQKMVTKRRGEYSARLKSAHRTRGNGCLSWPTIRSQEPGQTTVGYGRGLAELIEGKDGAGETGDEALPF